ncbi:MAG: hypothetical protein WC719_03870 [Patescibacteria group bacterium]
MKIKYVNIKTIEIMKRMFLLAITMIVMASLVSCNKENDPFNEPPAAPEEDSVVIIVYTNILTEWKSEYVMEKNAVGVWTETWNTPVYQFAPGVKKVLKGEEARAIIGKEVVICSLVTVYRLYMGTTPSPAFETTYSPAPVPVVIEKNKTYTYHFDVTFVPV